MMKRIIVMFASLIFCFLVDSFEVEAYDYHSVCKEKISAENGTYGKCGDNHIYLIDDMERSSHFVSTLKLRDESQILYAGKIDGIDTFYSNGFYYYSVIYDNQKIGQTDMNYWTDIILDNVLIYDSSFKDIIMDQSKDFPVYFIKKKGTYLIRQHVGNEIVNVIKMIVIDKKDYSLDVEDVKYDGKNINSGKLIGINGDLSFSLTGGKYGFNKTIKVEVNSCSSIVEYSKNIVVSNDKFRACLKYNVNNKIDITVSNGLGNKRVFSYNLKLLSNDVSISLENSVSAVETSSRRIVINAKAGTGKKLNENLSLYYWSKSANDGLNYQDFLKNYDESRYRGIYSADKGVILRNTVGTYYLYALAVDDDSIVVVRSDEYILKKKDRLNNIRANDIIFFVGLAVLSILPIVIYINIRGKDTD